METTLPQQNIPNEQPAAPTVKPESVKPPENKATVASGNFVQNEKHGVVRTMGTVLKTVIGEGLTFVGGKLIGSGIATAALVSGKISEMKTALLNLSQNLPFREFISSELGGKFQAAGGLAESQVPGLINQVTGLASVVFPGIGIGTSVIGFLSTAVGTAIGWSGVKHGSEKLKTAFKIGKLAELGTATLAVANPALAVLYPIVKGFNLATAFIGHTKRP